MQRWGKTVAGMGGVAEIAKQKQQQQQHMVDVKSSMEGDSEGDCGQILNDQVIWVIDVDPPLPHPFPKFQVKTLHHHLCFPNNSVIPPVNVTQL